MKEYRDHYFLKAKREHYPARSVYKLKELDAKFRLLRPGQNVLDLGAAPGSWSLGAAERVGGKGFVLACDIQSTDTVFPPQVEFAQEDIFKRSPAFEARLAALGPFDVVLSDMAPRTTGTRFTDQARSLELAQEALAVARQWLRPGGHFVVKIFMGPDIQELLAPMRSRLTEHGQVLQAQRAHGRKARNVLCGPALSRAGRAARHLNFLHTAGFFRRFMSRAQQMGQHSAPQGTPGRQARQSLHQGR